MTPLKKTPILLVFLKEILKQLRFKKQFINNIVSQLYLQSRCGCGQKDCATVMLKRKRAWQKEGSYTIDTIKGIVILHFLEDGFLELEAVGYIEYPYKEEIKNIFNKKCVVKASNLSMSSQKKIKSFFIYNKSIYELRVSQYEKKFKIKIDYRSTNEIISPRDLY